MRPRIPLLGYARVCELLNRQLGYDDIYTEPSIPYAGPPFYWVTMPDQFTWSYLHRTVRRGGDPRPQFVETAMVSSHAPWTPKHSGPLDSRGARVSAAAPARARRG